MEKDELLISIITINFNNADGLEKTLNSIFTEQTYDNFESIVIDGGSKDKSVDIVRKYEDKIAYWVSEPDKGIYNAMNKGIIKAKGEYLLFLNSGDYLISDILQSIKNNLKDIDIIYGNIKLESSKSVSIMLYPSKLSLSYFINNSLPHCGSFIKRTLFKDELYDENYKIVSDWIFFFKSVIMRNCSTKYINTCISIFDAYGISSDKTKTKQERYKFLSDNFPPLVYQGMLEFAAYEYSDLKDIIIQISETRKFQKRIRPLILFLYRINRLFSKH